jgi:hypothetical protein
MRSGSAFPTFYGILALEAGFLFGFLPISFRIFSDFICAFASGDAEFNY